MIDCPHTNNDRADRIAAIVEQAMGENGTNGREAVIDLLADIRHYCLRENIAYHGLEELAYRHYLAEQGFIIDHLRKARNQ